MPVELAPIAPTEVENYSTVLGAEYRIFGTGYLNCYPLVDVQAAVALASTSLDATIVNNSGSPITGTAANLTDGNTATTADINAHTSASPSSANDWIELDLGQPFGVVSASLKVTAGAGQTLNVWQADSPGLAPGAPGTWLLGSVAISVGTLTVSAAAVLNGRFLLIESVDAAAATATFSEIGATVYPKICLALVQDTTVKIQPKREYLWASPQESVYAVDCADSEVAADVELTNATIDANALMLVTAAAIRTVTTSAINTAYPPYTGPNRTEVSIVDGPLELPLMTFDYRTVKRNGTPIDICFLNAKPKGIDIPFGITSFIMPKLPISLYQNSQGKLLTWTEG